MAEVDEKSETIASLKRELEDGGRTLGETESRVAQVEGEVTHLRGQLEHRGKEGTKLRSQLEGGGRELGELRNQCESLTRERTQLRDDLSTMTQVGKRTQRRYDVHVCTNRRPSVFVFFCKEDKVCLKVVIGTRASSECNL